MSEYDLLSIGDATLDVYISPTESETFCKLDDKESLLCFTYGDKIPVKSLDFSVGGNAANNSVGTRRLGVKSAIAITLGDDEIGDQIVEKLIREEVDTHYVFREKGKMSNYSTAITVAGERTLFTYKSPVKYQLPSELPEVSWVYLTSIGEGFGEVYQKVVDWVGKTSQVKLAFNPGSRQLRAGVGAIRNVLEAAYIVYVNREEAEALTGMQRSKGMEKELAKALCGLGPKISIITDGADGSFVFDGTRYIKAGVLPVDAYERTGAGDAFGSGCLSALIKGKSFEEALLWGTVNSASVIGYIGPQKGLLREQDMPSWLEKAKSSGVKVEEF